MMCKSGQAKLRVSATSANKLHNSFKRDMIDTNAVPNAWNPGASIESLKPLYWLSIFQFGMMYWNRD